jgi:hypothetical protein
VVDRDRGAVALLDDVVTVLVCAGYADPFSTTAAMRLRCLFAAGRLEALGARPDRAAETTTHLDDVTVLSGLIVIAIAVTILLAEDPSTDDLALDEARHALHAVLTELG